MRFNVIEREPDYCFTNMRNNLIGKKEGSHYNSINI